MAAGYPVKADYANGDVLTATNLNDLAGTVNLAVNATPTTATQMAGKNAIINGDFSINQRNFTSVTATSTYTFDRWLTRTGGDGTGTFTPQTFTLGAAPVAGYESANYLRVVTAGSTNAATLMAVRQYIESARTYANQTVTLSFYAKAASGTPKVFPSLVQSFGTGGSPSTSVETLASSAITLSTSWARYTTTITLPSISGKTLGTANNDFLMVNLVLSAGTDFASYNSAIGIQNNTFEFWGFQLESGADATPFQTATGTKQGELAACQRYYYRATVTATGQHFGNGNVQDATTAIFLSNFPTIMRTAPTALEQSGTATDYSVRVGATNTNCSAVPAFVNATPQLGIFSFAVASGLVAGNGAFARPNATSAYVGWSAEL